MIKKSYEFLNQYLERLLGITITKTSNLYPWQTQSGRGLTKDRGSVTPEAQAYLRLDNPRLLELESRYKALDPVVTTGAVWTQNTLDESSLLYFRGDNPYIWQSRGLNMSELIYALTYYYCRDKNSGLLGAFREDGAFGAHTYEIASTTVSRDSLDSVLEVDFLQRHLGMGRRPLKVLDVGAGYGRLAYRFSQAFGNDVTIYSTDAYARSSFLCEFYLRYRGVVNASVVFLDEVESVLQGQRLDLAINVHSFSECTIEAIQWWVRRLVDWDVRHLMVVPNRIDPQTLHCLTNDYIDMEVVFENFGFKCVVREPRYSDPVVQRFGLDPCQIALFERVVS